LGVQALLEHWWAVGILEKLKWLFDENIYQNKMATHMTNSIATVVQIQLHGVVLTILLLKHRK
jgi:hypothetical protein